MKEQQAIPFFDLAFRPFFSLGALFGGLALLLWGLIFSGHLTINLYGGNHFWHVHEMLFGFVAAIISGFLLTAVQTWTGQRSVHGIALLMLVAVWLSGRLAMLFPGLMGDFASAVVDLGFIPLVAFFLARPIIKTKQKRNFFLPLFLFLFALPNLLMHMSVAGLASIQIQPSMYAAVMLVTLLMSLMAGRVVPMFTANGTHTEKVLPMMWLEIAANGSVLLLALGYLAHPFFTLPDKVNVGLFLLSGMLQMIRCLRWKPWITLSVPLLWSLHGALFFIWLGLIVIGLGYAGAVPLSHAWHLLTVGGMGGLILAMISRIILGHTGRPLTPPRIMNLAFLILMSGALIRAFGPWIMPAHYLIFIDASILCWLVAFAIFLFIYTPMIRAGPARP